MSSAAVEHVRVCPQHGRRIEERGSALICPVGDHAVAHWRVVRTNGRPVYDDVADDPSKGVTNVVMNGNGTRPGPVPAPQAAAAPRPAPPAKVKAVEVLQKAKLGDAEGNVLWLRLMRLTSPRCGVRFVVRWERMEPGATAGKVGTVAVDTYTEPMRTAFIEQLAQAKKDGWKERPITHRELVLSPIPKPVTVAPSKKR